MKVRSTLLLKAFVAALLTALVAVTAWFISEWKGESPRPEASAGSQRRSALPVSRANSADDLTSADDNFRPRGLESLSGGKLPANGNAGENLPGTPFLRQVAASLKTIEDAADSGERETGFESLVSGTVLGAIPEVMEYLRAGADTPIGRSVRVRLIRRWAEQDPQAAASWVKNPATGQKRVEEISALAVVWGGEDFDEAMAWAKELKDTSARNAGLTALAYEASRSDPMKAFRVVEELPNDASRGELITHTAVQWAASNPREAFDWVSKLPDQEMKQRLLVSVLTEWADSEPAAAANVAVGAFPAGKPQEDAVMGIVQRWVQKQPEEVGNWVLKFPAGALQDTAMTEVIKLWVDQDPERAGEWVKGLSQPLRDQAVAANAEKLAVITPASVTK